ncbi:MAG: hypothetical protein PUA68_07990 [Bacilli bacterium]|nr:hypothetical protein [Bacilli bacterium]
MIGRYYSVNESNDCYSLLLIIKDSSDCDMSIPIATSKHLYDLFLKHCEDNDLVGIKNYTSINDNELIIVASKVTFLYSRN